MCLYKYIVYNLKTFLLILAFIPLLVFSQTKTNSIISELKLKIDEGQYVLTKSDDSSKTNAYRFCGNKWSHEIGYLKSHLNSSEINELKSSENTALKLIGIICYLEKNNSKEIALKTLNNSIDSKIEFLMYTCSYDVKSIISLSDLLLDIITNKYEFFKPNFDFTENELKELKTKVMIADYKF